MVSTENPLHRLSTDETCLKSLEVLARGNTPQTKYRIRPGFDRIDIEHANGNGGEKYHIEPFKQSLWARWKALPRRRWIIAAICIILFLAVFLPILFLAIFPAIVQQMVDSTAFSIQSAMILAPTANSVEMAFKGSLAVPGGFSVHLNSANLSLFLPGDTYDYIPYANVVLPASDLSGNASLNVPRQNVSIMDIPQFTDFLRQAVQSKTATTSLFGTTDAFIGKLKAPLTLNKAIQLQGLGGFHVSVGSTKLLLPPPPNGTNIIATLNIPNPSFITVELGNVTLDILSSANSTLKIGQGFLNDVLLTPGNNSVPMTAKFDIPTVLANLRTILQEQSAALSQGSINIATTINSTMRNGEHLEYYEGATKGLVLSSNIQLKEILNNSLAEVVGSFLAGGTNPLASILGGLGKNNSNTTH